MRREQQSHTLRRLLASCCLLVLTAATASAAGWTTSGTKIVGPTGAPFTVAGVNWYGFETRDNVAHGMWTKDYKTIIAMMSRARLPLHSGQALNWFELGRGFASHIAFEKGMRTVL